MHGRTAYPNRKISETFLDFAAPVLRDLPSEAPEHRAREALQACFTAWNAVVFADVLNDGQHLDEIRRLTADNPKTAMLMEQLIARIHYIDVAAEQLSIAKTLERFDEPARKIGVAVVPSMAYFGG